MPLTVDTLLALAEGVAEQLVQLADPAQHITWRSTGAYVSGERGIYMATIPTTPDVIISLSPRQLTADPTLADAEYALQARYRGIPNDPRPMWAIRGSVRDVILGRWPTVLPNGLAISLVEFAGGGPLGQDNALRHEWADNFTYRLGEHRARPF